MGHPLFAICLPFSLFPSSSSSSPSSSPSPSLSHLHSFCSSSSSSLVVVMDQGEGDVRAEKCAKILSQVIYILDIKYDFIYCV